MSIQQRIAEQKLMSATRLESLTGGLAPATEFTEMNLHQKQAQLKNMSAAMARYIAEDGRVGMLVTLTFPTDNRMDIRQMNDEQIIQTAEIQYMSIMSFLNKMRRSKRVKYDVRYICVMELQSDGNLHAHIFLSVKESDLFGMIEFVFDFKKRYGKPYTYKKTVTYPIGRLHIGISARYKNLLQQRYSISSHSAKSDSSRLKSIIAMDLSKEKPLGLHNNLSPLSHAPSPFCALNISSRTGS